MDPAALGTTIIGLDRIHQDDDRYARAVARREPPRRRTGDARRRLADALRRAAERIAPAPIPA